MTVLQPAHADTPAEDLMDLAPFAFRMAQQHCDACRNYHSVWGYERLAKVKGAGFESERDILGGLLREGLAKSGSMFIAGAADAGLLALVLRETKARNGILIADRCATPLAVSRRFADTHGLDIPSAHCDLTEAPLAARHGFAFAHNTLLHVRPALWGAFLCNIRHSLAPNGALLLVHRILPLGGKTQFPLPPSDYAERTIASLAAKDIPLPEDEASFRRRLESRIGPDIAVDLADLETTLHDAGFAVVRRIDHERRKTVISNEPGEAKPVLTHIFLAART